MHLRSARQEMDLPTDLYATDTSSAADSTQAREMHPAPDPKNRLNRNHPPEKGSMAIRLKPIKDQEIVITLQAAH